MKKIIVIAALVLSTFSMYSQNMPEAGNSGLGFNITGLWDVSLGNYGQTMLGSADINDPVGILNDGFPINVNALLPQNILMYKRYYDNGLASRFGLGLGSISSKVFMADSTFTPLEYSETTEKINAFSFGINLGLEKHMDTEAEKVDPYLGADIMFSMLTGIKFSSVTDITGEDGNGDAYSSNSKYDVNYPGGMGVALNLLGGFNYFFSDNISIGGEVGVGFGMVNMGGEWTTDFSYSSTTSGTTTTTTSADRGEYKSTVSGLQVNSYGGVNLMIYW